MTSRPPLCIHLLGHPKSKDAQRLALQLTEYFRQDPLSGGVRVPVFLTPDRGDDMPPGFGNVPDIDLDAAEHSIVVVIADARMTRRVGDGTGDHWKQFVTKLKGITADKPNHYVLPVSLDNAAFSMFGGLNAVRALMPDDDARLSEISLNIATRSLLLLKGHNVDHRADAVVQFFISHAKDDLNDDTDHPVNKILSVINSLPIKAWFDAGDIPTGVLFAQVIEEGVADSTVVLAIHTDSYSGRPWCRREVLDAKRAGAELVVVNALTHGELRHFPYMGNAPIVRWQADAPDRAARSIIDTAVREAMRVAYNLAVLSRVKEGGEVAFGKPPEAVTIANTGDRADTTYLYPDPPLGEEELDVLSSLKPLASFVTPLAKVATNSKPDKIRTIAVSISESADPHYYGVSDVHQAGLMDETCLYLFAAGLRIGYGGALKGNFSDKDNFTRRLFAIATNYRRVFGKEPSDTPPIVNVPPWPLYLDYDDEWNEFGNIADAIEGPQPELPWPFDDIFPEKPGTWRLMTVDARQRYAWARGLTAMRERMLMETQAQLVIGGKLEGFSGVIPGVVEEAWIALRSERTPLYLVGGFGGAARAVGDVLMGVTRSEFTEAFSQASVDHYDEVVGLYREHGEQLTTMLDIGQGLNRLAAKGLGDALKNGLDDDENRELILCSFPERISELVLTGLSRLEAAA